jgi:glycosyltransferase involved in cell wall biosynthesis
MLFSVVTYTFNREKLLAQVLDSVCNQSVNYDLYEVVVVDNRSTDGTRSVVERFAGRYPNVRYAYEDKPGSSAARNRGWKEATGNYVAFIDDDAKAPAEWLQIAQQVIGERAPDVLGGPVYPFYMSPKPVWYKDEYATFSNGDMPRVLSCINEFFHGSNLFARRRLLEELGGFDERLGMFGNRLGYGEETAFLSQVRARKSDAIIFYEPKLFTFHLVRPEKFALSWQLRSRFVLGRYNYRAYGDNVPDLQPRHILGFFALPIVIAWEATLGVLLRKRKIYPRYQNYMVERTFKDISTWGKLYQRMLQVLMKRDKTKLCFEDQGDG